jgi:hypothetical protein
MSMRFSLKGAFIVTSIACLIAAFPFLMYCFLWIIFLVFLLALVISPAVVALVAMVVLILVCMRRGIAELAKTDKQDKLAFFR